MKLGFAIKVVSAGAGEPLVFNRSAWVKKVVDVRDYLKLFGGLQGTDNTITFMTFEADGCFLTVLRSISGRDGDSLSGWIYIPNSVVITGEQLVTAHSFVCDILKESNIATRKQDIEDFFSVSYPDVEMPIQNLPSQGEKFGVRFIDQQPMNIILDNNRYQPYYANYKCIFLLNKFTDIKIVVGALFEDLTTQPMKEYAVLKYPTGEELSVLKASEGLYFANGDRFDKSISCEKGTVINLIAKRKGFDDIVISPFVVNQDVTAIPVEQNLIWKKTITARDFAIQDSRGTTIHNASISIEESNLTPKGVTIKEDSCDKVQFVVSAPDYEPKEGIANFSCDSYVQKVILHRKVKESKGYIKLKNGRIAKITLEARGLSVGYGECPIKGYTVDPEPYESTTYVLDKWFICKQRIIGALYALSLCLLIWGYFEVDKWLDTVRFDLSWPFVHELVRQKKPLDVISYLDNNAVWEKDSLESYSNSRSLFDELNEFRFDEILKRRNSVLDDSKNLKKIISAIEKSIVAEIDPKVGKEMNNGKYNDVTDMTITIDNYIVWIQTKHISTLREKEDSSIESKTDTLTKKIGKEGNSIKGNVDESESSSQTKQDNDVIKDRKTTGKKRGKV